MTLETAILQSTTTYLKQIRLPVNALALQLRFLRASESMGNHDSKIVDAGSVD
jgi:hypothetical protein